MTILLICVNNDIASGAYSVTVITYLTFMKKCVIMAVIIKRTQYVFVNKYWSTVTKCKAAVN